MTVLTSQPSITWGTRKGNGLLGASDPLSAISLLTVFGGLLSGLISRILKWLPSSAVELLLGVLFSVATGWHPSNRTTVIASGIGLFLLMANSGYEAGEEVVANHLRMGSKLAVVGAAAIPKSRLTLIPKPKIADDAKVTNSAPSRDSLSLGRRGFHYLRWRFGVGEDHACVFVTPQSCSCY